MHDARMPLSHLLLALSVVFVWGTNFVVIKWGLAELPPFLFAALRFTFCVVPWIAFVKKPDVPWRTLIGFGLLVPPQFGLLFVAMQHDVTPGLASVITQLQVFFTIAMAMWFHSERVRPAQVLAVSLALGGMAIIGAHALDAGASVTPLGLVLVIGAAAFWAGANMMARAAGRVNPVAFIVWASPFALPPLFAMAFYMHGSHEIAHALRGITLAGAGAVAWQSIGNTLFGVAAWNWLLARHPASTVAPSALLVPVFGMTASAWLLNEPLQPWKVEAAVLVLAGLALNLYGDRLLTWARRARA